MKNFQRLSTFGLRTTFREWDESGEAPDRVIATVGVFNEDGHICMGQRNDNGAYTMPGGHVDEGEEPLDGAMREVYEETGIELAPDDLTHLKTETVQNDDGETVQVHAYRADVDSSRTSTKEDPDAEVKKWEWHDVSEGLLPEDVAANLHVPYDRHVLLHALDIGVPPMQEDDQSVPPPKASPAPQPKPEPAEAPSDGGGEDRSSSLKKMAKMGEKVFKQLDDMANEARAAGLDDVAKLVSEFEDHYWDFKRSLAKIRESVSGRSASLTESGTPADDALVKKATDLIKHNVGAVHGARLTRTTPICVFPNHGADNPNTRPMSDLGRGATGVGVSASLDVPDGGAAYSMLRKKLDPLAKAANGQVWYDPYDDSITITLWFPRTN